MCQCIYCEQEILSSEQYALIGGQPMHEQCCAEYSSELYGEDDAFECDEMVYPDEDDDWPIPADDDCGDYSDDPYGYGWDDGYYDDDPNPYSGT